MKILILEDTAEISNTYEELLSAIDKNIHVEICTMLPSFDESLFDNPGIESYDKVIIDAMIDTPFGVDLEKYEIWLKEKGLDAPTVLDAERKDIPIYGWDYYNRIVTTSPETKNHLGKFLIVSGYAELIREKTPNIGQVKILNKGDSDFVRKFRNFILSK